MRLVNTNMDIVMLDIDGTIKDLVKENTDAIIKTMKIMDRVDLKLRGKLVLWINKINMYLIKTGLIPTNKFMQSVLLLTYSILLLKRYKQFKNIYFKEYNKEDVFFSGVEEKFDELYSNGKNIYLVTKNIQNQNILKCSNLKGISKLSIGKQKKLKYYAYKTLVEELGLAKKSVIIIGDNLWDDVFPALILGVNVIWCNMYSSKFKKIVISLLSAITKKVISCDDIKMI